MSQINIIALPFWHLPLMVFILFAVLAGVAFWLRRLVLRRGAPVQERDWSVPPLTDTAGAALLRNWEVRCKIVAILALSFMIASLKHPVPALYAVGIAALFLAAGRVSMAKVLMRLLAITGFVGMFLVVMPLTVPTHPGDTVVVFGGLQWLGFNLRGLLVAGTIAAKAVAITLLMEPLLSTAPLPVTLHGLSRLGAPEVAGQMVLLSYRYLHVFRHEARRMSAGMQVRGFRKRTDLTTLKAVANFLGMLFVRSFERTERVFDAMRARGYNGRFPEPEAKPLTARDVCLAAVCVVIGIALITIDRIGG